MKTAPEIARVLVVDDEATAREALAALLSGAGVEVVAVAGAEEARRLLRAGGFRLVVTDLRLRGFGDREGFELLAWIRDHHPGLPVIVVTGLGEADFEREATRRGAAASWRKGRPVEELLAGIGDLGIQGEQG